MIYVARNVNPHLHDPHPFWTSVLNAIYLLIDRWTQYEEFTTTSPWIHRCHCLSLAKLLWVSQQQQLLIYEGGQTILLATQATTRYKKQHDVSPVIVRCDGVWMSLVLVRAR